MYENGVYCFCIVIPQPFSFWIPAQVLWQSGEDIDKMLHKFSILSKSALFAE